MMPSDSCLKDAWLQDSVMTGADLESADLHQAILSGADLRAAVLTSANPPRRASDFRSPDGAVSLGPTDRAYSRRASTATEMARRISPAVDGLRRSANPGPGESRPPSNPRIQIRCEGGVGKPRVTCH